MSTPDSEPASPAGIVIEAPKPSQWRDFTEQERGLMRALKDLSREYDLEGMLKGALLALQVQDNPEAYVHAAQSARELIEKIGIVIEGR